MASQNYAQKTLDTIDERFTLEAQTESIVNNDITFDFTGVNTVNIYTVNVVAETNYVRSGYDRFGSLVELGTGLETYVLSQDKAFTFSVDSGNRADSMMVTDANKAVKRQVREVSIPTVDVYRLAVADAYARANSQGATGALTKSNVFEAIIAGFNALVEAEVPQDGNWTLYVTTAIMGALMVDPEFKLQSDMGYQDNKKGYPSQVMGMTIKVLPASYYATNFNFMIIYNNVLVSPIKFAMIRLLDQVRGIDGVVAEGRRYYDCFVIPNKGKGIYSQHSA